MAIKMMVRTYPTDFITGWLWKILGIIFVIVLANVIAFLVPNPLITNIVAFLNGNILLLIGIVALFFLGALFYYIGFPINLIAPIFDAFGSVFLVVFLINLIVVIDEYINTGIGIFLESYSFIIYVIIFILVLILGYLYVFQRRRRIEDRTLADRRDDDRFDRDDRRPILGDDETEEITEETVEEKPNRKGVRTRRRVVRRRR